MPPKKGKKGKKKKAPKIDPTALTEVDKTFYELTITDLNRKLARLRSLTTELEEKNTTLETDLSKLDDDRNDIIIYLKRTLQEKTDEISELQERLRALDETRQDETKHYETKISDLENEYRQMHEQLTSEIKLLEGKLNSLEEFRAQRDELMKKFEDQELAMEEQEKRHRNELYDIERKFIIGKDKLKKDMEARLLQLSSEFQEATELRIAATTHRVIRENIAINNELDTMLQTHDRLHKENSEMKTRDKTLRQEAQLHESEKKKALAKIRIQLKVIDRLTTEHEDMVAKLAVYHTIEKDMQQVAGELQRTKQTVLCLNHQIRILEQNVHALKCKESSIQNELNNTQDDNNHLSAILGQAVFSIKEVLEIPTQITDEALRASKRETLLTKLFTLLTTSDSKKERRASLDTICSLSATYQRGDLGFVPKPLTVRSSIPTLRDIQAQTGPSFEEFLAIGQEEYQSHKSFVSYATTSDQTGASEMGEIEEESDVYFDEEEDTAEDSFDFDEDTYYQDSDDRKKPRGVPSKDDELEERKESLTKERRESKESATKAESQKEIKNKSSSLLRRESKGSGKRVSIDETKNRTSEGAIVSSSEATTAETSPLPEDEKNE